MLGRNLILIKEEVEDSRGSVAKFREKCGIDLK